MRFTTKVSSQETGVSKSGSSDEKFIFTVKKSEVTNGASAARYESEGASGGTRTLQKSSTLNVNREQIEDFASVRDRIFPVIKARSWVDATKDLLTKIDPKSKAGVLFTPLKSIPGAGIGYTLAIMGDHSHSLNYILTSHLDVWSTSESSLQEVAIKNLEKTLDGLGENLWSQSRAGIHYIDSLGSLSASVVLLPRFIARLDVESGDAVVVVPSSDLCMVVGSKMETRLCIVGEMSLRYSSDPHHLNTNLRLNKSRMVISKYSPKSFAGEFPVPSTLEEVAGLKLRVQPIKRKK